MYNLISFAYVNKSGVFCFVIFQKSILCMYLMNEKVDAKQCCRCDGFVGRAWGKGKIGTIFSTNAQRLILATYTWILFNEFHFVFCESLWNSIIFDVPFWRQQRKHLYCKYLPCHSLPWGFRLNPVSNDRRGKERERDENGIVL